MRSSSIPWFVLAVLALAAGCSAGSVGNSGSAETLVSITVTPTNHGIAPGTTQQFTATGTYSNNSTRDLTASAVWSSSSETVATINNTACSTVQATALAAGATTITAAVGSISGSTTLTVSSATLASLAVQPASPSITAGSTEQFTATGTFSDKTTQVVTSVVTWSSSSTSVATISNAACSNGLAAGVAMGTSLISASSGSFSASTNLTVTTSVSNIVPITVNGSLCSTGSYPNKPCVSVTVCTPGTTTCQTISDLLLDTGSYGLRVFKQALTVSLTQVTAASGGSLAECVTYADGSSQWGPIQKADVILGGEPAVSSVPIQVVDSTFSTHPASCTSPETGPSAAGFNGILGVGLFVEDCGSACAASATVPIYFGCSGSTCSSTTVPLSDQVQNPAALLAGDNNGVIVQLPGVSPGGVSSVDGKLVLGIGTESNNTPSGVTTYPADQVGTFKTTFNGSALTSFIDSGSNGLFFPAPSSGVLPTCSSPYTSWYCPSSTVNLSATNTGYTGLPSGVVSFQIGRFSTLINTSNSVFVEIGGPFPGYFDWGLPFYLGRSVYVGFDGKTSSLGTGPYWAY